MAGRPRRAPPLRLVLDTGGAAPLHRRIGEQLRRAILEHRLGPGTMLPSSRLMAADLTCARGTVLAALDQLVAEGYLVARAGSGLSVALDLPAPPPTVPRPAVALPPALPRRTLGLLAGGGAIEATLGAMPIAFPLGQPDRTAFPFALWSRLLEQEWRRPDWRIAAVPHPFGHPGLRAAIAHYLGAARGFACDPAAVVVTSGVRQSVFLLARVVLEAGERAWIEEPGYPGMAEALAAAEVAAVAVPVDAAGFSPEAAEALAPEARLAVVAPSHHFPLGTVLTLQRRLALLAWAQRRGGWIIEDDFDGEYRYSGRPLAPLRALDHSGRVAYLGSFSKILFPALRLSFMVLPASLVAPTEQVIERISTPAPLLGQGALARFIAEGHLAAHLRRTRALYAARQQALIAAAHKHLAGALALAPDAGGMHLVATFDEPRDDRAVTAAAARYGVRVAPLSTCFRGTTATHALLLGYAGTPEPDMEPATSRLAEAIDKSPLPLP